MDAKLTLKLDQDIIEKAKKYASDKKMSLSRIVEAYLETITSKKNNLEFEISPFVKSMSTGVNIPNDIDIKENHKDFLMEKHK